MDIRLSKISLACLTTLSVSACVSTGEPQLFAQGDRMRADKTIYTQCSNKSAGHSKTETSKALDPDNINLLNWNIYKGRLDNWDRDLHSFIEEKDIVTIQEAHLSSKLKSVLHRQNYQWTLNTAFHLNSIPAGVMTASRIPALDTCGMRHKEPLIRTHKTTLVSYFPIEGVEESLLVANIHGINFTFGTAAYKEQIRHLFEIVEKHDGPIMIAGDFNTWSHSRMAVMNKHAKDSGLSSLDYSEHDRTEIFGLALDHVFFRGLEAVSHHSWDVASSDHNPTRVHFRLARG